MTDRTSSKRETGFSSNATQRMADLQQMHREASKIFTQSEKRSIQYLEDFAGVVSLFLSKIEVFTHHIIWEPVEQRVPHAFADKVDQKCILMDITDDEHRNAPLTQHEGFVYPRDKYYTISMTQEELAQKSIDYLNQPSLQSIVELPLKPGFGCIDLPILGNRDNKSLPQLILTLIYAEDKGDIVGDEEFLHYLVHISHQIALAWGTFVGSVVDRLLESIDRKLGEGKKTADPSPVDQMKLIARVLTWELQSAWCGFYMVDEQMESLKLEAGNLDLEIKPPLSYLLNQPSGIMTESFAHKETFCLPGRRNLEEVIQPDQMKPVEKALRTVKKQGKARQQKRHFVPYILFEHGLVFPIAYGARRLGVIALYRSKNASEFDPPPEKRFPFMMRPFCQFETQILKKVERYLFNFSMSHVAIQKRMRDIRNILSQVISPISASISSTEAVITRGETGDIKERLHYVNALSKIAAHYVTNFETLLDIDTRRMKLRKSIIPDLRKYLIEYARLYTQLARPKCIHINVTPDTANDISLEVDKDLFEVVILNLLDNAVLYSFDPEDRMFYGLQAKPETMEDIENILVTASNEDDHVVMTISSCGIEIKEEERKRIFQREFRGSHAPDRAKGTGIGLYLVKNIIQTHGGTIQSNSGASKYNTVFRLTIPKRM